MAKTVFCRKYQKDLEAMEFPPMPGAKGKELMETVSKKAWQEWLQQQTMLINEKHLNLMDPDARKYLTEQLENYLSNESTDKAEGYVPPK
jgi:Fe-S cluster biosynthesis and repair protein YggX